MIPGKCDGHECDQCKACQRGRCCRKDNPDYRLPELGSIVPFFGELGVRNDVGDEVECHICGGWFKNVGSHSWVAHDVTALEYRSAFGLHGRGLISSGYRAKLQVVQRAAALKRPPMTAKPPTPEQHRAKFDSLEYRRQYAERQKTLLPRLLEAGHSPESLDKMRRTKQRQSLEYAETRQCAWCGRDFDVQRWQKETTCSKDCRDKRQRQVGQETMARRRAMGSAPKPPLMTSEIKAKLSTSARERWATASDQERDSAKQRLMRYMDSLTPAERQAQRQAAAEVRGRQSRMPHYCTAGCGRLIPTATPLTCSPECRKVVRQRTARRSAAKRVS